MGDLIFTLKPALATTSISMIEKDNRVAELKTKSKENWFIPEGLASIEQTNLLKSLLKYDDVYACTSSPYLRGRIETPKVFDNSIAVLHLAFKEPFDIEESISIIDIWGNGLTPQIAQQQLVKRVTNMYDYEDLLLHCYFNYNESAYGPDLVSPPNRHVYDIYDPQELAMHNLQQSVTNKSKKFRAEVFSCGLIFTNVDSRTQKQR